MILVMLGAPIGAYLRLLLSKYNDAYPTGTLIANLLGSSLLGLCAALSDGWSLWICIGILGSFTTFSTLNLELVTLWQSNKRKCLNYALTSYIFGPLLFAVGYLLIHITKL